MSTSDAVAFWDGVYAARPAAANPQPNARLTETVTRLPPGDALDLGCGDGGDALWLARLRWQVTAADISAVAVERLAALAHSHGLGDHLTTVRAGLRKAFPPSGFDPICAHYLHSPCDLDRVTVLRSAAHALRPGGRLLVVEAGSRHPLPEPTGSRRGSRPGPGDMDGRADRRTPPDRDRTGRAHRRGRRSRPPHPRSPGSAPSIQWALTHMIEETGRHAGHAGILRELVDGTTGR